MTLDTAATLLSQLAGAPVRNYSTRDFGRDKNPDARSVVVSTNRSRQALEEFRRRLDPKFIAFIGTTRWLGDEQHSDAEEIVVAEADSQFDALTIAQSDAANYDMFADDLIKKLRAYDELCGIDIFHAETDTIEFRLRTPPPDLAAFCADLYEFCPDIVDQGVGSVEALAAEIRNTHRVFLWWD